MHVQEFQVSINIRHPSTNSYFLNPPIPKTQSVRRSYDDLLVSGIGYMRYAVFATFYATKTIHKIRPSIKQSRSPNRVPWNIHGSAGRNMQEGVLQQLHVWCLDGFFVGDDGMEWCLFGNIPQMNTIIPLTQSYHLSILLAFYWKKTLKHLETCQVIDQHLTHLLRCLAMNQWEKYSDPKYARGSKTKLGSVM